ncbi:TPA: hypothetical protein QCU24_003533 [Bacillus cereus]|nr:hypothetical protein [Bacillus cereus]
MGESFTQPLNKSAVGTAIAQLESQITEHNKKKPRHPNTSDMKAIN